MSPAVPGAEVSIEGDPPVVVISILGRIPPEELSGAVDYFRTLIQPDRNRFLVDLSRAEGISSGGIGIMLYYQNLLKRSGGQLAVVRGSPEVMRQIGPYISPVMKVVDTRAEGLALL